MSIYAHKIEVTTTGSAGAATGTGVSPAPASGRVVAIHVDLPASPGTTTDIVVATNAPVLTILTLTNVTGDGWYFPRQLMDDTAGADLTGVYEALAVAEYLTVSIAQSNAGAFVITVLVEA